MALERISVEYDISADNALSIITSLLEELNVKFLEHSEEDDPCVDIYYDPENKDVEVTKEMVKQYKIENDEYDEDEDEEDEEDVQ